MFLRRTPLPGGACDGYKYDIGYVMRGGREMDNHFEVMWDLLRSIPSLETEGASVLDEYYWLNKEDPNKSLCRATVNRGQDAHTDGKFAMSDQGAMEIMKLFFTPDEQLQDKKITDIFDDEVFYSNFWMYWRTMFAFENWHSALEMKLYLKRYIHHIGGLPDFTALRFTRYNQYESIILPMVTYLKDHGVDFQYETKVTDVQFRIEGGKKQASGVTVDHKGEAGPSTSPRTTCSSSPTAAAWRAAPSALRTRPQALIPPSSRATAGICGRRSPHRTLLRPSRKVLLSAGAVQLGKRHHHHPGRQDPSVYQEDLQARPLQRPHRHRRHRHGQGFKLALSWTLNRQQQFRDQPKNQLCVWVYGLFSDKPGDYVKKPMRDCTGREICMEWLYHIGVPEEDIAELAEHSANTVPVMMPYIDAFFMPRAYGDRPDIVPKDAVNFAFLGQFAETGRDTIFTTEYSMRTGMEAVYTLLNIDRGVPEVWGSTYDVPGVVDASVKLRTAGRSRTWSCPYGPHRPEGGAEEDRRHRPEKFLRHITLSDKTIFTTEQYRPKQKAGCCMPEAGNSTRPFVLFARIS